MKLEDCPRDQAHQYLIVRDRKKAYSLYLLHTLNKTQSLLLVTKISKAALNFHSPGQLSSSNAANLREIIVQHVRQELAMVTEIEKRQKPVTKDRAEYVKAWRAKKKKEQEREKDRLPPGSSPS